MEIDYQARRVLLEQHIESYWNNVLSVPERRKHLLPSLERWKAMYGVLLRDERFLALAEPVTKDTPLEETQYYMRYDGVFCFLEGLFKDTEGREIICANPLRFPFAPRAQQQLPYLSSNYEHLFGLEIKTTTMVFNKHGYKDYGAQLEEVRRITVNQRNTRNPIQRFYFHPQGITQCPVFRRENFIFYLPARRALKYMLFVKKFEPVVRGTQWLLETPHLQSFLSGTQLKLDDMGATGSCSYGDEEDKEDFDVVFYGSQKKLVSIRNFIIEGTQHGIFKPLKTKIKRKVRVHNREIILNCTGKPVLFCPFFIVEPRSDDCLKHAVIVPRGEIKYFEARVLEDSENILCPSRVIIGDFDNVFPHGTMIKDGTMLVMTHGFSRGELYEGSWISGKNSLIADIYPANGNPFPALISRGWYDINVLST